MATIRKEIFRYTPGKGRIYSGYGKFDSETGRYLGSAGGYGKTGNSNNRNNGASKLQNYIVTSGARQEANKPKILR